ncbi:MAG TPA: hypothetical protein VJ579_00190 [Candidatus Paceibacterota bacterium]|nr:hypothetical protein [Candidatus Paceibacterota bacterium]
MSESHTHKLGLSAHKNLLFLAPVFFVWIEIALPIMVAPLFGQNDMRAFVYSFVGYGIYLIFTYLLIVHTVNGVKGPHPLVSKKLMFATYIILGIIILAGIHAGTMIFLGLSQQNLSSH